MKRIFTGKRGISFVSAFLYAMFILVAVLCATRLYDLKIQRDRLTAESEALLLQKQALQDTLDKIRKEENTNQDRVYVENIARTQLDMVYPGEIIFRVSGQ